MVKNDVVTKTVCTELIKKVNVIQTNGASDLVKKADQDAKIVGVEKKTPDHHECISTNDFNEFLGALFDERFKQAK